MQSDYQRSREGSIGIVRVGFFFILVGMIFLLTPNILGSISAFFNDSAIVQVPNTQVFIPAPASVGNHLVVYSAFEEFSLIWGIFQIFLLFWRAILHSSPRRKARTVSSIVFWLGISYLTYMFLIVNTTIIGWFLFWIAVSILIGLSLIVRGLAMLAFTGLKKDKPHADTSSAGN